MSKQGNVFAKDAQRNVDNEGYKPDNGNVMLNFYFVIQDVIFISIFVNELFHSNSLCLPQLTVFEPPNWHEIYIILPHLHYVGFSSRSERYIVRARTLLSPPVQSEISIRIVLVL